MGLTHLWDCSAQHQGTFCIVQKSISRSWRRRPFVFSLTLQRSKQKAEKLLKALPSLEWDGTEDQASLGRTCWAPQDRDSGGGALHLCPVPSGSYRAGGQEQRAPWFSCSMWEMPRGLGGWQGLSLKSPAAGTGVQPWQLIIPRSQITKGPFQHESLKKAWY